MKTCLNDCILISDTKGTTSQFIFGLKNGIERLNLTDEGPLDKYLGIKLDNLSSEDTQFAWCIQGQLQQQQKSSSWSTS